MKTTWTTFLVGVLAITMVGVGAAQANLMFTSIPTGSDLAWNGTVGCSFTPTVNMTVTALGTYDDLGNGIATHGIDDRGQYAGIFNASGNLLASVMIPSGTAAILINEYRYMPLETPLSLTAGTTYILASTTAQDAYRNPGGETISPDFTNVVSRWTDSGFGDVLANPTSIYDAGSFAGPNMLYSVPEPVTMGLLALGGLAMLRRRK
jgi:hypothetical protein